MSALFAFLSQTLAGWISATAARIGYRYAVLVALIAVYVAAAGTFLGVINGLLGSLIPACPQILQDGFAMLPTNTDDCLAAVVASEAAAYVYRQVVIVAGIKARVV
jgi:hypothetical protein